MNALVAHDAMALIASLSEIVGGENVLTGEAITPWAQDVYRSLETPLAVVRPGSAGEVQRVVQAALAADIAIVPRGGGASYTDGYLPKRARSILLDTGRMTAIKDINELNATVTVEPGVTWAALREALAAKGWRTPFWGPFSGFAATIGGTASQNAISHGSGAHGISAQSFLSMQVVAGTGDIISTGSAAIGSEPTNRHHGPDLTGLFTGDAGALGVKVSLTLPLLRVKPAFQTASFSFPDFVSLHQGMRAAAIEQLDDSQFALDTALSQGQIARQSNASSVFSMALSVLRSSPSLPVALGQLLRMATAGTRAIGAAAYACHFILEGVDDFEAKAKLTRLRTIMTAFGVEIPNSVPAVVRGMPFAPLFNVLGPAGERWVPLHGVLSHTATPKFHEALKAFFAARADEMKRLGVWSGGMFETVGPSGFLYEIALYWPDARTTYHENVIPPEYLATLPTNPENLEARSYVHQLKTDLIALYAEFGATHFQLGKAYPYASALQPEALALVRSLKAALDPKGLMNPGALGL